MDKEVLETLRVMETRGFKTHAFETASEMRAFILNSIEPQASVGFGGSVTSEELGLYDALAKRGNPVYFHWKVPPENRAAVLERAHHADAYIMSSNAVTSDGVLLNIDGNGNRVGALVCGPKTVFIVLGTNKIVKTREEAMARVKSVACPANARRLGLKTPCALTGKCTDCRSSQRMCNSIVWTEAPRRTATIHICVAACSLGF